LGSVETRVWVRMQDLNLIQHFKVPEGRLNLLNLAQDASPGLRLKGRLVPQGLIMFDVVPRTNVLG
jgi:hypothetical protein